MRGRLARGIPAVSGAVLGGMAAVWPGAAFILLSGSFIAVLLWRVGPARERRFLVLLFVSGWLLRCGLSTGLDLLAWKSQGQPPFRIEEPLREGSHAVDRSRRAFRLGDSDNYSERGYALAQYAAGKETPILSVHMNNPYGQNTYLYAIGGFYHLFGFSPISVKWLNAILGALLGPALFFLGWEAFRSRWVARGAALLGEFFPSLVLWSLSNMKDPLLILVSVLILWGLCRLASAGGLERRWGLMIACLLLLGIHASLRFPAYTAAMAVSWLVVAGIARRRRWASRLAAAFCIAAAVWTLRPAIRMGISNAFLCHARYLEAQGEGYRILPEEFYSEEGRGRLARGEVDLSAGNLLRWTGQALFHYLGEPLPGSREDALSLVTYPQMVFWYFALVFAAAGLFLALRAGPPGIFLVATGTAWLLIGATTNGNVGTVFRFRDMLTPLILLLGCLGLWGFLGKPREAQG